MSHLPSNNHPKKRQLYRFTKTPHAELYDYIKSTESCTMVDIVNALQNTVPRSEPKRFRAILDKMQTDMALNRSSDMLTIVRYDGEREMTYRISPYVLPGQRSRSSVNGQNRRRL